MNILHTGAGVFGQGSQIVIIREDLAKEVGAWINMQRTLRMEGTNGNTLQTLGCVKDLNMHIGDVSFTSFTTHAHVVHTVPLGSLLAIRLSTFCSAGMKTTLTMLICRSVTRPTPRSSVQSSPKHSRKHKRDLCLPKPAEQLPCVDALECYVLEQRTLY
jgi:hypothetical protein